ncbi:MAG: hypothetical protein AAB221_03450 [Bacteroidota bacterium]
MKSHSYNLLVFFHHSFILQQEEERLFRIVTETESPEQFCMAHELVNRNRITANSRRILKEARRMELRPFRFLINKN